jgi:hypothetical protein
VERSVLDAAQAEIEAEGTPAEREALARSLTSPPGRARQSEELPKQ